MPKIKHCGTKRGNRKYKVKVGKRLLNIKSKSEEKTRGNCGVSVKVTKEKKWKMLFLKKKTSSQSLKSHLNIPNVACLSLWGDLIISQPQKQFRNVASRETCKLGNFREPRQGWEAIYTAHIQHFDTM